MENMNIKILVVDDESRMRKLVRDFLAQRGLYGAGGGRRDGGDGRLSMRIRISRLIILDVMMPKMDGWQVCREIRESSKVPIIMLTAQRRKSGTNCRALSWEWTSISPSRSARRSWWRG